MGEPDNPYRAPASREVAVAETVVVDPATLRTASRGRRFGTFVVDYLLQFVFAMLLMVPAILVGGEQMLDRIERMNRLQEYALGLVVLLLYYIFFESLWARTPGKWVFGTRVVDDLGGKPRFGQVLGRSLARIVPFEAFSILFANDADVRGWHDRWPRTRVVRTR
jgi:uncharacterized RDD family membrane protein YckC